jgi:hypothetical protein
LNIEQFCENLFNKMKTKYFKEIGADIDILGKPLMSGISWR